MFVFVCQLILKMRFIDDRNFFADFMTSGIAVLLEEYALDHDPTRFALIVTLPVIYCVSIVRIFLSTLGVLEFTLPSFLTVFLSTTYWKYLSHVRAHSPTKINVLRELTWIFKQPWSCRPIPRKLDVLLCRQT